MSENTKMNPEVKAQWLAALRSGRYAQGTSFLRGDAKHYCCLGVLCTVAEAFSVGTWQAVPVDEDENPVEEFAYSGETELLPENVSDFAGIGPTSDPEILLSEEHLKRLRERGKGGVLDREGKFYSTLSSLNDADFTFLEIADLIEEQL